MLSGAFRIAAFTATVESGSFSADSASLVTGIEFAGGLAGLFFMGLDGDWSRWCSSSAASRPRRMGIWVTFFGLRGFFSALSDCLELDVVWFVGVGGRRAGLLPRPFVLLSFLLAGSMFSLSVSSNLTLFFGAALAVVELLLFVTVPVRDRAVVLLGAASPGRPAAVAVFLRGRPLALVSSLGGSEEADFVTLVRVARAGSKLDWALFCSVSFLGRPRARLAGLSLWSLSPSSSCSSARVLRLAAVLLVGAVAVEGPAAFALAAAVTIFAVFADPSLAFAAARARVILLGGESIVVNVCGGGKDKSD